MSKDQTFPLSQPFQLTTSSLCFEGKNTRHELQREDKCLERILARHSLHPGRAKT
jgi:hypothetical protein